MALPSYRGFVYRMISPPTDIVKLLLRFMTGLKPNLVLILIRATGVMVIPLEILSLGFEVLVLVSKGLRFLLINQIEFSFRL